MTQFTTSNGDYLACTVPVDILRSSIWIDKYGKMWYKTKSCTSTWSMLTIPAGTYTIIGIAGELSEDQKESIVEYTDRYGRYICYDSDNHFCLEATHSFASLLRLHNISPDCLILKREK